MKCRHVSKRRRGATVVEFAIVLPVLSLLLFGTIIGGLGVFRYQRIANMARDASRYAAVHSAQWAFDFNNGTLLTATDIYNNSIKGQTNGFDTSDVGFGTDPANPPANTFAVVVQYDNANQITVYQTTDAGGIPVTMFNRVRVLIRYNWRPECLWGTIPLQSTSEMRMCYQWPK